MTILLGGRVCSRLPRCAGRCGGLLKRLETNCVAGFLTNYRLVGVRLWLDPVIHTCLDQVSQKSVGKGVSKVMCGACRQLRWTSQFNGVQSDCYSQASTRTSNAFIRNRIAVKDTLKYLLRAPAIIQKLSTLSRCPSRYKTPCPRFRIP